MRTRIKFCGLTRADDIAAAVRLGVDALGFVFHPASPRCVTASQAQALTADLPPLVTTVALFMNAPTEQVRAVLSVWQPSCLQFHGDESPDYCASFGLPYIKAIAMRGAVDLAQAAARHASARALLLDGHAPGEAGGGGQAFDWQRVNALPLPVFLAGGLHAGNVEEAIAIARPYAVDVSSGIESAPGHKDAVKMADFAAAVRRADA